MMKHKRLILAFVAVVLVAYIAGSYQETRADGQGGWCAHFVSFMVCNQASTDYVMAAR